MRPIVWTAFALLALGCNPPVTTTDAGTDAVSDIASDATSGCQGQSGRCAPGASCQISTCPDGTPISCLCSAGSQLTNCTGLCAPADGGTGCSGTRGHCAPNSSCQIGTCPDGVTPVSCQCSADSQLINCTGACPPPVDAGSPDAGVGCPGLHGTCAPGTTCQTGLCPDGVTPVSCLCSTDSVLMYCTGACPP